MPGSGKDHSVRMSPGEALKLAVLRWRQAAASAVRGRRIQRGFGVIVRDGKAFLPSVVQSRSGMQLQIEPVYVTALDAAEMERAALDVLATLEKSGIVPDPVPEEWKKRQDPLLAASGAKNWKELTRTSKHYGIAWVEDEIHLTFSRANNKGGWEFEQPIVHAGDTPLRVVLEAIVKDAAG